jgi:hypothetical protein
MSKQTAVEWLATYLKGITFLDCDEVIEQAKEMEKQQIIDAANTLLYPGTGPGDTWAEQYYNKNYGGSK